MKIIRNFIGGMLSTITNSNTSSLQRYPHSILAEGMLKDWRGVAKDIKRVQTKLKAEAHDGRYHKK